MEAKSARAPILTKDNITCTRICLVVTQGSEQNAKEHNISVLKQQCGLVNQNIFTLQYLQPCIKTPRSYSSRRLNLVNFNLKSYGSRAFAVSAPNGGTVCLIESVLVLI